MIEKAEEQLAHLSTDPVMREAALERERRQIAALLIKTAAWDEGRQKGLEEGRAESRAEGRVNALLSVLDVRGLVPTVEERARIVGCMDVGQLETWVRRAVTVGSVSELFA
jgi:flagellar biosynthesis/type III secretory pathway protein FliH